MPNKDNTSSLGWIRDKKTNKLRPMTQEDMDAKSFTKEERRLKRRENQKSNFWGYKSKR